jgi:hypothetical protein
MKKAKQLWIVIAVLFLANILVFIFKPGGENAHLVISNLYPVICSLIAAAFIFSAVRGFKVMDFTKLSWIFIMISMSIFVVAEATYAILELGLGYDMDEEFPTFADYFWVTAYIPLFAGLPMMLLGYKKGGLPMGKPSTLILVSLSIFVVSIFIIYFVMAPILNDTETGFFIKAFYLFYPIADILIVIPTVLLVYITSLFGSGSVVRPWKYLAGGFILITFSDLLYSYLDWMGLYGSGNWIDLGWNFGYLLIAMSGLYQYQLIKSFN